MTEQEPTGNQQQAQQEPPQQQAQQTQQTPPPAPQQKPQEPPQQQEQPPAGSTVSRHKYERDTGKLQAEVDELKAENEGYKALRDEFEQWKSSQEAEKSEKALKDAGCIDVKAASARLPEFDGDISKLKEECPYLFASTDNTKSTGGNPKGKPGGDGTAKTIRDGLKMRKDQ